MNAPAAPRRPKPAAPAALPRWRTVDVAGRPTRYLTGGVGDTIVFLHGWGLAQRTYRRALDALVRKGFRVYAPAMPGFGGTPDLPAGQFSLVGYAAWVAQFMTAAEITQPVTLVGHSFGGGVAIQTTHDFPDRVARLALVNSIGGSAWTEERGLLRAMRERPVWDWGLHLQRDIMPTRQFTRVLPVVLRDGVPNLLRNPGAMWRAGHLARMADLTAELEELKRRRTPVTIVWSKRDDVITSAATASIRAALGDPQQVTVEGNHTWLLAEPKRFGEVITDLVRLDPKTLVPDASPPDVA